MELYIFKAEGQRNVQRIKQNRKESTKQQDIIQNKSEKRIGQVMVKTLNPNRRNKKQTKQYNGVCKEKCKQRKKAKRNRNRKSSRRKRIICKIKVRSKKQTEANFNQNQAKKPKNKNEQLLTNNQYEKAKEEEQNRQEEGKDRYQVEKDKKGERTNNEKNMEAENDRQEEGKVEKEDEQKEEKGGEEAEGLGVKEDQDQVIKIGTANVRGVRSAKEALAKFMTQKSIHIMAIQEIQIEDQKDMCNIAGYKNLINVGSKKGKGVAFYIRSDICKETREIQNEVNQMALFEGARVMAIEIMRKLAVINVYAPVANDKEHYEPFYNLVNEFKLQAIQKGLNVMIIGD